MVGKVTLYEVEKGAEMEGTWVIKIEMGNEAMQDREDAAELLRNIAYCIGSDTPKIGSLQDINGNTVARWEFLEGVFGND